MSEVPHARRSAPSGGSSTRAWLGFVTALALACGEGSLDETQPAASSSSSEGGTLPAMDTGLATAAATEANSGAPTDDDPRLCPDECRVILPVDWTYASQPLPPEEGSKPPFPPDPDDPDDPDDPAPGFDPQQHLVPVMLRDPSDGSLVLVEQRKGNASLHRLDRDGHLEWNRSIPLPCDVCEVHHVVRHPSGDLLLSASGLLQDRGYGVLAARYDPVADALVWATATPLLYDPTVAMRSGDMAALSNGTIAQLYLDARQDFNPLQVIKLITYDADGLVLEEVELDQGLVMELRHPLLARTTANGDLMVGFPSGSDDNPVGRSNRLTPPLWTLSQYLFHPTPLDDAHLDARGHTIELGHTFDGTHTHLVLIDREGTEPTPRWAATLALDSTTGSRAALAMSPDAEPYVAIRTSQRPGQPPGQPPDQSPDQDTEPLVGLSLARWTSLGELRWRTTLLDRIDDNDNPIELAVDDDEGLILATVLDGRLRVQRRRQRCDCG